MTEQQADEALTNASTFLNHSCKYILNDGFFDIDKYGPYIDKIKPFFVSSLENRIYWILEEFVYREDLPLVKRFPYLKRCLNAAATWTDPLETLCTKYKDTNLAEETIRLTIKHLIKDGLIDGFVSSIVLNNRLNRICRELDALGIEQNFLKNFDLPDFIREQESTVGHSNSSGTRILEGVNGPNDSDLEVEIGSSNGEIPRSRKRARKRAATYDSPSNANIDRSEPAESQLHRGSSQDSFRISEDLAYRLESDRNLFDGFTGKGQGSNGRRKVHRSLCTLAYRVQHSTSDWKQARLKFIIKKVETANCNCKSMKAIKSCWLLLPCKVPDIKDRIFEADPMLMELCLIVMRRKFENNLRNVCSCLNDVLRRMNPREIKQLNVFCEIRASYIGFKLRPRDKWKCWVCLLVARVPICRNVRKRAIMRETSFRDSMQAHDMSDPASLIKSVKDSSDEEIGSRAGRSLLHSPPSDDSPTVSKKISKTNTEKNSGNLENDHLLLDHFINLPTNDPCESFTDSASQNVERFDTEKVISEVHPTDDNSNGTDLFNGVFQQKVPDCTCVLDENGDLHTKTFCGATNCIKRENIPGEGFGINIEEEEKECRENGVGIGDLRTEIFERPKEEKELYSAGASEEEPSEIISGLQSKLITSLNSNEKLDTRKRDSLCCNKSISCSILFDEEENLTCFEKCLKIMKSSSLEDEHEPLIASSIKGILDLIFVEAQGRFQTLQQLNVKSYSVSVQTLEVDPSPKGENAESFINIPNVAVSVTEESSRNLEKNEYKADAARELVDQGVSKTGEINFGKSKKCVPGNICENSVCTEDQIFTPSSNIIMDDISSKKNMNSGEKRVLSNNVTDIFTKRCEPKLRRPFVSPEINSKKNQSHVEFSGTATLMRNSPTITCEENYFPQRHEMQTIPSDLKKAKVSKTLNSTNHVDVKTNISRSNYRVRMYREEKRYRVSSLNVIGYGNLSADRKWSVSDKFHRTFSGKSINRIKHLIHTKLSRIFPDRNKATNTSKTFLRNDKYLVSILKAKASRACQPPLISLAKSCDPTSKSCENSSSFIGSRAEQPGLECSDIGRARRLLGGSERYENSIQKSSSYVARPNADLKSLGCFSVNHNSNRRKLSTREEYGVTRNVCTECLKKNLAVDLGDTLARSINRNNGKHEHEKIANNQQRLPTRNIRNSVIVNLQNHDLIKMNKKSDHVRTFCNRVEKEISSSTLTRFRCCDKENHKQSTVSSEMFYPHRRTLRSGENSQPIRTRGNCACSSKAGDSIFCERKVTDNLEELYHYKYVNNLSLDFRMKLAHYVNLCKSVKSSLLNRLRPDDIYEVSTTSIPSAYADRK